MTNERTLLHLNPGDYGRLRALAAREGRSVAEIIREAVAEYLEKRKSAEA